MDNPNFHIDALLHDNNETLDFDGPLSLILQLLHRDQIEIRDISISDILDQYNRYLFAMQEMDLDIASEFIQMASYLLYIKTQMMLSGEKSTTELDNLISSLEKLQAKDTFEAVKSVCPQLADLYAYGSGFICKGQEALAIEANSSCEISVSIDELIRSLYSVLIRSSERVIDTNKLIQSVPAKLQFSVRKKSIQISEIVRSGAKKLSELYSLCSSRSEIIATFISVLELCVLGYVTLIDNDGDYSVCLAAEADKSMIDRIAE